MKLTRKQVKSIIKAIRQNKGMAVYPHGLAIVQWYGAAHLVWGNAYSAASWELSDSCIPLVGHVVSVEDLEAWYNGSNNTERFADAQVGFYASLPVAWVQDIAFLFRGDIMEPVERVAIDSTRLRVLEEMAGGYVQMRFRGSSTAPIDLVNDAGFRGVLLPVRLEI